MFRASLLLISVSTLAFTAAAGHADNAVMTPEVVVSATRTPVEMSRIASSVTVISRKEIEQRQSATVTELLRTVPGVTVAANGGMGQTARVFLRGAESRHTLMMVDGVVVNDPSDPADAFDFAYLTTDDIERIEVLRGPQSTLYGADAVSGVIQIFTRRGKGKPRITASAEKGSFGTTRLSAGSSGGLERFDYTLNASHLDTNGISAFSEKRGGVEADPHYNNTFTGSVHAKLADNFSAGLTGRYTHAFSEFDDFGADSESRTRANIYNIRATGSLGLFDNQWKQEFGLSDSNTARETVSFGFNRYHGNRKGFDWLNHFSLLEDHLMTVGLEGNRESFDSLNAPERRVNSKSVFVQDQYSFREALFLTAGARIDDHSAFGTEPTWRLTAAYHVNGPATKLKASCGTGYKAPSLFQLFDATYGNAALRPEKIRGCDAGFEQMLWGDKVTFGSTVFRNDIRELIDFDFATLRYLNVNRARMQGVETAVTVRPTVDWNLNFTHTYLQAEDENTHRPLLRRPKHQFTAAGNYLFGEGKGELGMQLRGVGSRADINTGFARDVNPFFSTLDANISYQIALQTKLYGRLENLLDKEYEEVMGYGSPGRAGFAGVKVEF